VARSSLTLGQFTGSLKLEGGATFTSSAEPILRVLLDTRLSTDNSSTTSRIHFKLARTKNSEAQILQNRQTFLVQQSAYIYTPSAAASEQSSEARYHLHSSTSPQPHTTVTMKGRPIDQLVYEAMFPKPKSTDPQNFQGLLQRQLVPEVRLETQAFYGHLQSQEAKYPGLDYSHRPHRNRLSRYPWHRRLFRAFDNLRLTESEIAGLTKWEGTRWAKERFEKEQGCKIRDTTGDDIPDWVPPELRVVGAQAMRADLESMEDIQEDNEHEEDDDMDEDSDMEIQSVGLELNERLRAAVAQREAGNAATVMDEEWEQWLKDAVEAGGIPFLSSTSDLSPNANIPGTRPLPSSSSSSTNPAMHPRLLNAARLGQWQQIPDFLHNMVRQNIEANNRRLEDTPVTSRSASTSPFSSRPNLSPRARATPTSGAMGGASFRSTVRGLDAHFEDLFARRRPANLRPSGGTGSAWLPTD
jgi:hypothetical protein